MDFATDFVGNYLSSVWAIVALMVVLATYRLAAPRLHKLPPIPVGFLLVYLAIRLAVALVPALSAPDIALWLDVAAIIALYCAVVRIAVMVALEWTHQLRTHEPFPKMTRDFILLALFAVIVFVVLRTRGGVNLVGLVTTSAVLTAVIGFAAQSTLGNIFAGLALQLEKPFAIGDWIMYGDDTGQVVEIDWATTKLRTFEDEIVIVPNSDIAKSVLKNFSRPSKQHVMKLQVGLDYNTPPNEARRVLLQALHDEPRVLQNPKPQVRVLEYADFAITYQLRFAYYDYGTWPVLRGDIMNNLWYALKRARINIPFPIRDVRLHHVERRVDLARREREATQARANLGTVPVLATLTKDDLDGLATRMRVEDYGQGETIVAQGESGDSMYMLHHGSCEVLVRSGESPPIVVATLAPPAFFGEMSLLTGEPRSATVRATSDARLFAIHKDLVAEVLQKDPRISEQLAKALARRQAENAEKLGKQREDEAAAASKILARIKSFFKIA